MSVTSPIAVHAKSTPGRAAIIFDDDRINWTELTELIDRLGAFFAESVPEQSGIALHLPNSPALAILFLAAARAGYEAQIFDPAWPAESANAIIQNLKPTLVVTSDPAVTGPRVICLEDAHLAFDKIAARVQAPGSFSPVAEPDVLLPFYVGFTSGSTGLPKGYRRNHLSWIESFCADAVEFGIGRDDVVLAPGSLSHSLFLYALVNALYAGATVVLCASFRPNAVPALIYKHNVSVLYAVPTQLKLVLESFAGKSPPQRLRWILSSGAKWVADEMAEFRRRFPATRFAEFYGASELSFITVAKDGDPVPENSVGRAFRGVTLTIRDGEGHELEPGHAGMVFVESPFVFSGYATGGETDLYRAGPAMSVGDFGFLDQHGFLFLVGRAKRMIVSSGKNIFPEEIERALEQHPLVQCAAVFGIRDVKRGERLVALLSLAAVNLPTRAELTAHLRKSLPLHKIPRRFGVVRAWPMTRTDKTDFETLRDYLDEKAFEDLT